jgi:hypothetical protein
VLWRMMGPNGRILECVVRFAPGGVEVEVRSDGRPMIVRRFTTGAIPRNEIAPRSIKTFRLFPAVSHLGRFVARRHCSL